VIASIAFRNFKALRHASVALVPFNLVIGPNGSGKSSLIEAILQLRTLARLPLAGDVAEGERNLDGPEVTFRFFPPYDGWEASMSCVSESKCNLLQAIPLPTGQGIDDWPGLRERLLSVRRFELDHAAIGHPSAVKDGAELSGDGANLAAVLVRWRETSPAAYSGWRGDVLRMLPEYEEVTWLEAGAGSVRLALRLAGEGTEVPAHDLSQGTLYALALLALSRDPRPPAVVCIEELDRGLHPRMLREARDAIYRLSHPSASGLTRAPVQVIATTYSPYLLDLFREHPEEIVISEKHGPAARFSKLSDRADLAELMEGATLGDLWYTGVLGGIPEAGGENASAEGRSE